MRGTARIVLAAATLVVSTAPTAFAQLSDCGTLLPGPEAEVGDTIEVIGAGYDSGTTVTFLIDGAEFATATAVFSGDENMRGLATVTHTFTEGGFFEFETTGTALGAGCSSGRVGPVFVAGGEPVTEPPGSEQPATETPVPGSESTSAPAETQETAPPTSVAPTSSTVPPASDPANDAEGGQSPPLLVIAFVIIGVGVIGGGGGWILRRRLGGKGGLRQAADDLGRGTKSGYGVGMGGGPDINKDADFSGWEEHLPERDPLSPPGDSPHDPGGQAPDHTTPDSNQGDGEGGSDPEPGGGKRQWPDSYGQIGDAEIVEPPNPGNAGFEQFGGAGEDGSPMTQIPDPQRSDVGQVGLEHSLVDSPGGESQSPGSSPDAAGEPPGTQEAPTSSGAGAGLDQGQKVGGNDQGATVDSFFDVEVEGVDPEPRSSGEPAARSVSPQPEPTSPGGGSSPDPGGGGGVDDPKPHLTPPPEPQDGVRLLGEEPDSRLQFGQPEGGAGESTPPTDGSGAPPGPDGLDRAAERRPSGDSPDGGGEVPDHSTPDPVQTYGYHGAENEVNLEVSVSDPGPDPDPDPDDD